MSKVNFNNIYVCFVKIYPLAFDCEFRNSQLIPPATCTYNCRWSHNDTLFARSPIDIYLLHLRVCKVCISNKFLNWIWNDTFKIILLYLDYNGSFVSSFHRFYVVHNKELKRSIVLNWRILFTHTSIILFCCPRIWSKYRSYNKKLPKIFIAKTQLPSLSKEKKTIP